VRKQALLYDKFVGIETLRPKDNHTWKAKPGYSIGVLDRGLVRFDYPGNSDRMTSSHTRSSPGALVRLDMVQ
jgi:hypothetical protein